MSTPWGLRVTPRFRSVVFDVDSTLSAIEGVDWLATRCAPEAAAEVARLTDEAMAGRIPVGEIFGKRLEVIRPTRAATSELIAAYRDAVTPQAADCIRDLRSAGVHVVAVSGGFLPAVRPLCVGLGIDAADVHAVDLYFADDGHYAGYESDSLLAQDGGKAKLLARLSLPQPILAVGDGITDLAMRGVATAFCAFTAHVARPMVVEAADYRAATMQEITQLVLGGEQ